MVLKRLFRLAHFSIRDLVSYAFHPTLRSLFLNKGVGLPAP